MQPRLIQWTVNQTKLSFATVYIIAACANFYEPFLGVFVVWGVLGQAHEMIRQASTSRVIVALPLSRRKLTMNFWAVANFLVPITFVAGHCTYIAIKANFGTPLEFTVALMVKRGVFVMGAMASLSMIQVFYRWYSGNVRPTPALKQPLYLIPAVLLAATSIGFAWLIFSARRQFGMQDILPIAAAFALSWTSFRFADLVWCSRVARRPWKLSKQAVSARGNTETYPTNRAVACFKVFWCRYAQFGGGLWAMLVALIASMAYVDGSK